MMDPATVQAAEVIAYAMIQAMGMQAENQQRAHRQEALAYLESDFATLAENMRGQFRNAIQRAKPT